MQRIRRDDLVQVIAGSDKGKQGKVLRVIRPDKVLVDGINLKKHFIKANPQENIKGEIVEKVAPIYASNVMLVNPVTGKPDKVGFKKVDNKKVRYFKSNQEVVE